ncbi:hypothetical protein DLREEDagrD3_28810 [Denitratisoma sp. agr-D3]
MSRIFDRASESEQNFRDDALAEQRRRAGLEDKTVDDSATCCVRCDDPIPLKRRRAYPGTQHCVSCQEFLERIKNRNLRDPRGPNGY